MGSLVGSTVITVLISGWVLQRLHRGEADESDFVAVWVYLSAGL